MSKAISTFSVTRMEMAEPLAPAVETMDFYNALPIKEKGAQKVKW